MSIYPKVIVVIVIITINNTVIVTNNGSTFETLVECVWNSCNMRPLAAVALGFKCIGFFWFKQLQNRELSAMWEPSEESIVYNHHVYMNMHTVHITIYLLSNELSPQLEPQISVLHITGQYVYIYIYRHIYIYTDIYIYTHRYIQIYIYTQIYIYINT